MKKKSIFIVLLAVIAFGIGGYEFLSSQFTVTIPAYVAPPEQILHLEQGWTPEQQLRFHHTAQGTRLVPYAWFGALEQPCFSLSGCEMFTDKSYLARFGFIASRPDANLNPDGLPIGFARQADFKDPDTHTTYPAVGLTCAACHTGELYYGKYAVQVEGAPARIETGEFQKALGLAVVFTKIIPGRYGRFEKRVLGENASEKDRSDLKSVFEGFIENAKFEKTNTDKKHIYDNPAGFGRTDALTRIGNQVFAVDMKDADNFAQSNAAVRFPQIWDASWFTWVQYNSSISDPLVRNVGEALGVRASARLYGADATEFNNSVDMNGLKTLEWLLSGDAPYQGLSSPRWPKEFPKLDEQKVARGAELYKINCQKCHLPPVADLLADLQSAKPEFWRKNNQGKSFLAVRDLKQTYMGTDPHEAFDFNGRTAETGDLGRGRVSAGAGLDLVTKAIALKFFDENKLTPEQRIEWSGFRDPRDPAVRSEPIYKARPLNGIWAVSPYLHNGSIPNLYALLSPQEERPNTFWTGSKQFDPVKVGFDTSPLKGGYLFDVRRAGNSNRGHEFKEGPKGDGVIGPALTPEDRTAIIEYLKSL
jgi:mono/diheme cytochrome c family protein